MFRKILASLATLAIGIGLAATAALPAQASNASNAESYWVTETGETCEKTDFSEPNPTSYSFSDAFLAGKTLTKVIIKSGSSNGGGPGAVTYENTAYYQDPSVVFAADDTFWVQVADLSTGSYVHRDGPVGGPVTASGKGISHLIVCYIETPDEPDAVSGDATVAAQTCDRVGFTLVPGSITPVATTGVVYELWNADKTIRLIADFAANSGSLANGTYFVKVLPASGDYTVSEANTWLERVVAAYPGTCAPADVSGDATVAAQTCDTGDYTLVPGSITPVAKTGVVYELWNADKTIKLIADFAANSGPLANGTYFVKVLPASGDYTVSEANTWLERSVGAYPGTCVGDIKVVGDPFDTQECVPNENEELPSTWSATLTIVGTANVQYRVFFKNGLSWVDQGLWAAGVYTAGPTGDFPYGTELKVVAEPVGNYTLSADPHEWEFVFPEPFSCQLPDFGTVTPVVTFAQSCELGATYTLAIEGGVAGTVLFSVNGGPQTTTLGTFSVGSPSTITVVAVPAPGSGFEGEGQAALERTFTKEFPALEACGDLTTLALTGDDANGTLWIAGLLGLLGTALVRVARREGRVTAEN